ncbi:MAG: glycosyltransferase family 2 protein [Pseudomonadota bacterium]|nr:glycosyltransferase family 2 protein [Pseudomonadota bacterium]
MSKAALAWDVGVVIPAQNEECTIAASIHAVHAAASRAHRIARPWIVIVCDSCTDGTRRNAVAALEGRGEVIECDVRSVGSARRLGVAAVLSHFHDSPASRIWLANTDADTCVVDDWLEQQLNHADHGAAAVAGIVSVSSIASCDPDRVRDLLHDYAIFADGTHPHVHGANLGVRADAYLEAGGWSDKALAEDHCLWQRLRQGRWPVIASAASVVVTSGRLVGRAQGGFADLLRRRVAALHG